MRAGVRRDPDWDRVSWTWVPLWLLAGLSTLGVIIGLVTGDEPLWMIALGVVTLLAAAQASRWMSRRDDRGWWLAIIVMAAVVLYGVVYAVIEWAAVGIFGNWLAIATLWSLRHPPPFPHSIRSGSSPATR